MIKFKCSRGEPNYTSIQTPLSPRLPTEERGTSEEEYSLICLDVLFTGPFFGVKKKGTPRSAARRMNGPEYPPRSEARRVILGIFELFRGFFRGFGLKDLSDDVAPSYLILIIDS